MNDTQKEILKLARQMDKDDFYINEQHLILKSKLEGSMDFFPWTILGTFVMGFLFARKKSVFQITRTLLLGLFRIKKIQIFLKSIQTLLPVPKT